MIALEATAPAASLRAGEMLDEKIFAGIRRRMMLEFCKWDSQVGDVTTLSRFPIFITRETWRHLASQAERASLELVAAEDELLLRPELHARLRLPRVIRRLLRNASCARLTPAGGRIMRFDFHPTPDGWRISEVNADVPGGFTESSSFPAMMAEYFPGATMPGDPAAAWADAIAEAASGGVCGLMTAPGYLEDLQIVKYLAGLLRRRNVDAWVFHPQQLRFSDGCARLNFAASETPLNALLRFYQSEWLARLPRGCGWAQLLIDGKTPVMNPATSILIESKRFPLVIDALRTNLGVFRGLLPETRDPRQVRWHDSDAWIVKSALCNTGETVGMRELLPAKQWRQIARAVRWHPGGWIAQRRFEAVGIDSPAGRIFPCLGVYTVNGKAAGIYGRFSQKPLIDYTAVDVAVLLQKNPDDGEAA